MLRAAVIVACAGGVAVVPAQEIDTIGRAASGRAVVDQAGSTAPAFDVASVKPSPGNPPSLSSLGSLGLTPGRWRALRRNVVQLIGAAYPDFGFQHRIVGGPAWAREDQFDIEARMDPGIPHAAAGPLVAQLLAERFALRIHTEQRPLDVYVLKVARADGRLGPQLQRSKPACVEARTSGQPLPSECRGAMPGAGGLNLPTSQMADFVRFFTVWGIDRPILDRTGLSGYFDVRVFYQCGPTGPLGGRPCSADGVSLFTALQEQAGLKLEAAREVVDVLVIDSVERPSPD